MHSPTFPGTFSSKNLTNIYVGTLQNIYFNIKDYGHFDKFVLQNWFSLYQYQTLYQTLVCKPGVWSLLWAPEAVVFLTSKYVSSYYPEHFLLTFQNNFT